MFVTSYDRFAPVFAGQAVAVAAALALLLLGSSATGAARRLGVRLGSRGLAQRA